MSFNYISVCSGIECPSVAWEGLGWNPTFFSEIEQFPSAVLKHHYPEVPNLGDMTKIHLSDEYKKAKESNSTNLVFGGTPCQSFSLAGLRKGLDDPRGNLALGFLKIVNELRPRWVVWENVPGVLSSWTDAEESEDGSKWQTNDFDTFTQGLRKCGYSLAWRILDAQYFGVPQRRRRVFVVAHLGNDWRTPASVLFEYNSLRRNPSPSKKEETQYPQDIVGSFATTNPTSKGIGLTIGTTKVDYVLPSENAKTLLASVNLKWDTTSENYAIRVDPRIFYMNQGWKPYLKDTTYTLLKNQDMECTNFLFDKFVRRLTPLEYERLQGLPDNYTKIPYRGKSADKCPMTPRYKACGNGIAVPVLKWLGERIQMVDNRINNAAQKSI